MTYLQIEKYVIAKCEPMKCSIRIDFQFPLNDTSCIDLLLFSSHEILYGIYRAFMAQSMFSRFTILPSIIKIFVNKMIENKRELVKSPS